MSLSGTFGFLGYGNMGSAILEGLIEHSVLTGKRVAVFDPDPARAERALELGARVAASAAELGTWSNTVLLAVKPQQMTDALAELRKGLQPGSLVISIAAGVTIPQLQSGLGDGVRIVRTMPNTPCLVKAGATGIALGPGCTEADAGTARAIFEAIGIVAFVREVELDAVTALSGSGPAYFFYLVECLTEAGIKEGLDAGVARQLAGQTLLGAGLLLQSSGETAADLRRKVTSKGGTTEAALHCFQEQSLDEVIFAGVRAAAARSRALGS